MVLIISIYSPDKITSRITNKRFVLLSPRLALYLLAFPNFPAPPPPFPKWKGIKLPAARIWPKHDFVIIVYGIN